jgi:hypothetical protein
MLKVNAKERVLLTPEEIQKKGLQPGFRLITKDVGRQRGLRAFAHNPETNEEIKLSIPGDPAISFRELGDIIWHYGCEIFINPKTREYYMPILGLSPHFSKTPEPCT